MRLILGVIASVLVSGCSGDQSAKLAADWNCGPVEGLKPIIDPKGPAYLLVGEFTETTEAPAAFAEIACNLAAHQTAKEPLFVGVSDYVGGATDAETRMEKRLEVLKVKGAPIVIRTIGGDDHPYAVHNRTAAEKTWANNIQTMVANAGAKRAILLMPRADAIAAPLSPVGDRFAGYSPMPVFLPEGQVMSLEISTNPIPGATGPVIHLYKTMRDGFDGEIALANLTHPMLAVVMAEPKRPTSSASIYPFGLDVATLRALISTVKTRDEQVRLVTAYLRKVYPPLPPGGPPSPRQLSAPPEQLAQYLVDWMNHSPAAVLPPAVNAPSGPEPQAPPVPDIQLNVPPPQVVLPDFQPK
jgi:hypothetical protein